jgi:glycyl-tRNA synthetase beta chain
MRTLAFELASRLLKQSPDETHTVATAALYAKCDLTTDLVKEFTELQGIVGGLLARKEARSEEIATAIYDHYKPESMESESPRTIAGALVSLADRLDTLAGCFGVDLEPTGSKDPFALRRAAQGVIRIVVDHKLEMPLNELAQAAIEVYSQEKQNGKVPDWKAEEVASALQNFLEDRLRYYLRDVRGFAYDEVNAVLASEKNNVPDVLRRVEAVSRIRPTENFEPLAAAFKRMKNILEQARKSYGYTGGSPNPQLLESGPEKQLFERYEPVRNKAEHQKNSGDYAGALEAIASLRPTVDLFFDKILVMDSNPDVRNNRLNLLNTLLHEFSTIADFSEIVPRDRAKPADA